MKKLLSLSIVLISIVFMNCSAPHTETAALAADQQLAVKVDGMVCAVGCAKYIEKEVAKLEGVSDCEVNFADGVANIEFSSEMLEEKDILETITSLNDGQYKVTEVELIKLNRSSGKELNNPTNPTSKSDAEVSFRFPELVTYFLSRVIRRV